MTSRQKSTRRSNRSKGRGRAPLLTLNGQNSDRKLETFIRNPRDRELIMLSGEINLTSDGSGVLAGIATTDGSGGSGSTWTSDEWSATAGRWGLVRCIGLRCQFVSNMAFTAIEAKGNVGAIAVSCSILSQAVPSSYAVTIDNFRTKIWNMISDTSPQGFKMFLPHDAKRLGYSSSQSPFGIVQLYAGCPGGIGWYGSGLPISTRVGSVFIVGIYEFRAKA